MTMQNLIKLCQLPPPLPHFDISLITWKSNVIFPTIFPAAANKKKSTSLTEIIELVEDKKMFFQIHSSFFFWHHLMASDINSTPAFVPLVKTHVFWF
jgi:hypothetical protein